MKMDELKRFIISIEMKALEKALADGEGENPFSRLIRDRIEILGREADWIHQHQQKEEEREGMITRRLQPSSLVIRDAFENDIDMLRDVYRHSSLTNAADHDLIAAHPEWLVWDAALLPFVRVADVEGKVVGFATARPINDFLELEDLFVDPKWMRQGIGSALIADIAARGLRIEVCAFQAKTLTNQ